MSNNKKTNHPKKQNINPLLLVAIAVGVLAIAVVFLVPEKKGTTIPNTNPANTSDSTDDTESTSETASNETTSSETASSENAVPAVLNEDGDVVIQTADISETATFYTMDVDGTTMGLFALKASDGTIRTAFDTCQVCNGSPYAYFIQQGDKFQCQNCGNIYSADMIGQERGGCNPVPIMEDEKTVTDSEIIIPSKLIKENAARFENWKKF